jgi:protein phosphatase 1 regulatory subunit 7
MPNLKLNGIDVCASYLTQRSYRAAYCDFLVPVTPRNKATALKEFRRAQKQFVYGLHISGMADLSFLNDFPDIRYLEVVDQKRVDPRPLSGLQNLRGLRLESPGAGLDFGSFPELEVFVGDWHIDNCNLDQCRELRQLRAWRFNPSAADLSILAKIPRLEWLQLTQTNIASLAGVEKLEDLRYFDIAYAPKLETLDHLALTETGIRELSFSHARKIAGYRPIASIGRLRRLKLTACSPMADLTWTTGLDHLDLFTFVETDVVNGDLTPLFRLPKLQFVGTMDKRHYNYKCDALNQLLSQRDSHY